MHISANLFAIGEIKGGTQRAEPPLVKVCYILGA